MIVTSVSSIAASAEKHNSLALIGTRSTALRPHNLMSPDLTTDRLCRELGVSRIAALSGFPSRTAACITTFSAAGFWLHHAALSDYGFNRQQIVDIAFAAGFSLLPHISAAPSARNSATAHARRVNVAMPSPSRAQSSRHPRAESAQSFDKWPRTLGHTRRAWALPIRSRQGCSSAEPPKGDHPIPVGHS